MKAKKGKLSQNPKSFREIRYAEKRDAMIKSAIKVFGTKGFHDATIEDITNELKMSKGSVYYYFKTKEELLYEAHVSSLDEVLQRIAEISKSKESPDEKIKAAIRGHLEVIARKFEGGFLLQHTFHLPENLLQKVLTMRKLYEASFVQIIEEGMKSGVFRVKDAKLAAFIILGAINWFLRWYSSSGKWSVEEISEAYVSLFCNGLLTNRQPI